MQPARPMRYRQKQPPPFLLLSFGKRWTAAHLTRCESQFHAFFATRQTKSHRKLQSSKVLRRIEQTKQPSMQWRGYAERPNRIRRLADEIESKDWSSFQQLRS